MCHNVFTGHIFPPVCYFSKVTKNVGYDCVSGVIDSRS